MRITNSMLINSLIYNVGNNLEKMSEKQDQLATGKRIQRPSDDPVLAAKIIKYTTDLSELEQYSRNTSDALSWLETTESSIGDIGSVLQRARELTVQAANGTNTVQETSKIKAEMEQLKKVVIADANFSFAGRYVFSFYHTDMPLLNDDGTYNIDITDYETNNKPRTKYEIGIGEDIDIDTNGLDLLNYDTSLQIPDYMFNNTTANVNTGAGTSATKAYQEINFPMTADYSGATLSFDIGGTVYNVNTAGLDFSGTSPGDSAGIAANRAKFLNAVQNAGTAPATLSTVADSYFNATGNLVIKSKTYGDLTASPAQDITFSDSSSSGTQIAFADGKAQTAAELITTVDVANGFIVDPLTGKTSFDDKEYVITFNDKTEKIKLSAAPPDTSISDVNELAAAIQTQLTTKFPGTTSSVTVAGAQITVGMAQNPAVNDGSPNTLTMRPIKAKVPQLIQDFDNMIAALGTDDKSAMQTFLGNMDKHINNVVTQRADIGARVNRLELVTNRIAENSVTFTRLLSDAQDADMAEVIMYLKNAENVYKSSLSAGARVIQPTLVDFLR